MSELKYMSNNECLIYAAIKEEMNKRDWETQLNLTKEEGIEIGEANEKIKIAKEMILENEPIEKIIKFTKLRKE